jgi:hypothetical protein
VCTSSQYHPPPLRAWSIGWHRSGAITHKLKSRATHSNAPACLNPLDLTFPGAELAVEFGVEPVARPAAFTSLGTLGDLVRAYSNTTFPDADLQMTDDNRAAAMQQADTRRIKRKQS